MRDFGKLSNVRYLFHAHELAAAKRSYYYLWWRYLRLSKNYWWLCIQQGKTTDAEFKSVYEQFGNVFESGFADWWSSKALNLFGFKLEVPKVELADELHEFKVTRNNTEQDYFNVAIPRHLSKTQVLEQLDELLKFHEPNELSERYQSASDVAPTKGFKKHILTEAIKVWCLQQAIHRHRSAGELLRPERFTQLWIGKKLGLQRDESRASNFRFKTDALIDQSVKVKVNRYISTVETLIANIERGVFPSSAKVSARKLWTEIQLKELNDAVANGEWIAPESATKEIAEFLGLAAPEKDWLDDERDSDLGVLLVELEDKVFKKELTIEQANEVLKTRGYFLEKEKLPKSKKGFVNAGFAHAMKKIATDRATIL